MPLTPEVLGTNADGSKNEDYCIYCYKDGKFTNDCTMDEMIECCAQFVNEVNKGLSQPITKEEFEQPEYKRLLKELGVQGEWEGIGHCAVGYIDGGLPKAAERKAGRVFWVE